MSDEEFGYLYHKGASQYLELVPGNARFHKNFEQATKVSKAEFADVATRSQLLDRHNVDWHAAAISWRPLTELQSR